MKLGWVTEWFTIATDKENKMTDKPSFICDQLVANGLSLEDAQELEQLIINNEEIIIDTSTDFGRKTDAIVRHLTQLIASQIPPAIPLTSDMNPIDDIPL